MQAGKSDSIKNIVYAVLLILGIIALVVAVFAKIENENQKEYAQTLSQQMTEVRYVLKLHNGKVAIFREGLTEPESVTDISEYSLCNYDREQLSRGVTVLGDIELAMRLEDYGS